VLDLAEHLPFARPLVNSGRLSVPCTYAGLSLNGPDELPGGPPRTRVGSPCPDAPVADGFLLSRLGSDFVLLTVDADAPEISDIDGISMQRVGLNASDDPSGMLGERYLGDAVSAVYLIRPDQHVAARWSSFDVGAVRNALRKACAKD
jgi:3-(3-hydroxy-phenyl)propionate hydroxylase